MAAIQNQGFGLNYNQGFGNGNYYGPTGPAGGANQSSAWDSYNQRQQNQASAAQQGANNQLQRYLSDSSNQSAANLANASNAERAREAALSAQTSQQGYASQERQANIAAQASEYPAQLQQERFQTVMPYFTQALQGLQGQGSYAYKGQGQVGSQPTITAAPVFTNQQIQQQVNSQRSQADSRGQQDIRTQRADLAGRGYGANSPLAAALESATMGRSMNAGATAERETRLGSAQANASQLLQGQQAQEQQFSNRQSEDIDRNKAYTGALAAMLGSFGQLI